MGKALGAAVATYMATELKSKDGIPGYKLFQGLILESAFTSAEDLIRAKTRGWLPKTFYSDNKWPTIYRLPRVQMKTLILHGADDEVVPVEMAY